MAKRLKDLKELKSAALAALDEHAILVAVMKTHHAEQ